MKALYYTILGLCAYFLISVYMYLSALTAAVGG